MIATGVMVVSQLHLGPTNSEVVNNGYHKKHVFKG